MRVITYGEGECKALLERIASETRRPRALLAVLGRELRNSLVDHFRRMDREHPNKLGGDRQHFWNGIANSVSQPKVEEWQGKATVGIGDPRFMQKLMGGPIRPVKAEALAIPLTAQSYGRYPGVFEREFGVSLFLVKSKSGKAPVLASKNEAGGITAQYVLSKGIKQEPDPEALPPREDVEARLMARAKAWAGRLGKRT
jgi:hypothetical protein